MSVTESDIECSTDSHSGVTETKARSRRKPRSSQSIRSEASTMMYDCEVRVLLFIFFFFTIVLC